VSTLLRLALTLAVLSLGAAGAAGQSEVEPGTLRDPENRFELKVPATWSRSATTGGALLTVAGPKGLRLTVTRIDNSNLPAWRRDETFFQYVIDGLARTTPGFRLRRKKRDRAGRVPTLNLAFYRKGAAGRKESVWMRVLFFRSYSLIAVSALPATSRRSLRLEANQAVNSFTPYFPPE
jgi:hypothetical protein